MGWYGAARSLFALREMVVLHDNFKFPVSHTLYQQGVAMRGALVLELEVCNVQDLISIIRREPCRSARSDRGDVAVEIHPPRCMRSSDFFVAFTSRDWKIL